MAKTSTVQPGYTVAVHLLPESAPENCYVGEVEAVDEYGILINLVHWDDKLDKVSGHTESLFIPWININSMLVSTETQPTRLFMTDRARKWKTQIDKIYGIEPAAPKKK
jgi:hypothetical protein